MHAAVGDAHGFAEAALLKAVGEVVGVAHDADQTALAGYRVVTPRPAGERFGTRGATVRWPLTGRGR